MSIFSLVIALVGFSRSFYLQNHFGLPELPVRLIVHGTVLTAWFFLACLQPALVWYRKTPLHRQTGIAGLFIAIAIITTGVWTVVMRDAAHVLFTNGLAANPKDVARFRWIMREWESKGSIPLKE